VPEGGLAAFVRSRLASESIGDVTLVATDKRALERCAHALEDPASRLRTEVGPDVRFDMWARPGAMSESLARFEELQVKGWESASGGEGNVLLKVSPRALLGGG
jgi:hypothetical protein